MTEYGRFRATDFLRVSVVDDGEELDPRVLLETRETSVEQFSEFQGITDTSELWTLITAAHADHGELSEMVSSLKNIAHEVQQETPRSEAEFLREANEHLILAAHYLKAHEGDVEGM